MSRSGGAGAGSRGGMEPSPQVRVLFFCFLFSHKMEREDVRESESRLPGKKEEEVVVMLRMTRKQGMAMAWPGMAWWPGEWNSRAA